MVDFCRDVLKIYERYGINDHIVWEGREWVDVANIREQILGRYEALRAVGAPPREA